MSEKGKKIERSWKNRLWNGGILAALVSAVAVFAVMLQTEKRMLSDYEKGRICIAVKEIPKGEQITKENYTEYFAMAEADRNLIPETAVEVPEELEELFASTAIDKGTLLTRGMFESIPEITRDMAEPVIAGFKAEDLYQVVGGVLRAGDRIHIYRVKEEKIVPSEAVDPSSEMVAELIWDNVFVQEVFDQTGTVIGSENTSTPAQRINIYMDKVNVAAFYGELAKGSLRVVKACD